ncbi:hypothetical protein LXA43DRAFT_664273 [Ganoderma leucocontextum]|nr:hypothetical protein LXA43DRAFT_664273 [Ganoderma leucocontextum]
MSTHCRKLPPELIGETLNFVSPGDIPTLLASALVCQDWLVESRQIIFRHINIDCQTTLHLLVSRVLPSHHLRFALTVTHKLSLSFKDSVVDQAEVLKLVECLPNLHTLDLDGCPSEVPGADLSPAHRPLTSLRKLVIQDATPQYLGRIPVLFPFLDSLTLCASHGHNLWDWLVVPGSMHSDLTQPSLSHLAVATPFSGVFFWLAGTPTRQAVKDLTIDIRNVEAYLGFMGGTPNLSTLTLYIPDVQLGLENSLEAWVADARMLLSRLADAEPLHFNITFDFFSVWPHFRSLFALLQAVGRVHRIRLMFNFTIRRWPSRHGEEGGVFGTGLCELDSVLADKRFQSTQSVELVACCPWLDQNLPEEYNRLCVWMERELPKLCRRGIVKAYVYDRRRVLSATGFIEHTGAPDFPRREVVF